MNSTFASGIALLVYAGSLAPILLAALRPRWAGPLCGTFAAAVVALAFLQTGVLQQGDLASTEVSELLTVDVESDRCEQAMDLLREARVLTAPPTEQGIIVVGEMWDQIPPEIQQFVVACAEGSLERPPGSGSLDVIRR